MARGPKRMYDFTARTNSEMRSVLWVIDFKEVACSGVCGEPAYRMGKILRRHDPFQSFQRLLIDAGVHQRGREVPRIRNTARIEPGFDRFLAVALFEGDEFRRHVAQCPASWGAGRRKRH